MSQLTVNLTTGRIGMNVPNPVVVVPRPEHDRSRFQLSMAANAKGKEAISRAATTTDVPVRKN